MRLTTGISSGKATFYDRNPTQKIVGSLATAVGPHTFTTRGTYTVPAARKFQIAQRVMYFDRATVATTIGTQLLEVTYTPNGGSQQFPGYLSLYGSNVGDTTKSQVSNPAFILGAGDNVTCGDSDASTGGTADWQNYIEGVEFDA